MRIAQLSALLGHHHRARERMGQTRSQLRRRQAERAHRRGASALAALKRAREQLQDPVRILDGLITDGAELAMETRALAAGVAEHGVGQWAKIKRDAKYASTLSMRSNVDLKDKWRNLLQLASLPAQSRRKQETPPEFLQRVLDLEAQYGGARRKGRKTNSKA